MGSSAYAMLFVPLIVIGSLALVFSSAYDSSTINTESAIINDSNWPDPNDTKYNTFFGNDPIGWFADTTFFALAKVAAMFALIGVMIIPVTILTTVPILTFPYVALYVMMGIGIYKVASPFVGK